jgi:3'-phosphoadenosine 5'-phosphosulfate sulfotransferase (PAPS reductase)/FAD synthetase
MPKETSPKPDNPLVVAYGLGVDSTAMLVEFAHRGIRPDLILFADTGGEKPETYQYLDVIQPFLAKVGFPDVTVVRYQPTRAVYDTLEDQCLHTGTLPSLATAANPEASNTSGLHRTSSFCRSIRRRT